MLANTMIQDLDMKAKPQSISTDASQVQIAFEKYRAYGIKLHMLADQCPEDAQLQSLYDAQQSECIKGQAEILKSLSKRTPETAEDAAVLMNIWAEELSHASDSQALSDTDRIAAKLFEFFQANLKSI